MAKHLAAPTQSYRNIRLAAIGMGLLMVGALVMGTTRAAFSDTTENSANTFASGSVTITDDDGGFALFDAAGMAPGDSFENCIEVTYTGDLDSEVRLYGTAGASSDLNGAITITVERGSGGSFVGTEPNQGTASCTGFTGSQIFTGTLTSFLASSNYATGIDSWQTPIGSSAVFRFFVEFDTIDDNLQGGTSDVIFTWEARNT